MDPKIYVASLSDYNNGVLHGRWIDANQGADAILDEVKAMLATSTEANAEEWAIHSFEDFGGMTINESDSFEHVAETARMLATHGKSWAAYVDMIGADYATEDNFEDAYQGEADSEQSFAEAYVDEIGYLDPMPQYMRCYFDYASFARDLFIDGYSFVRDDDGQGYVFADC